MKIELHILQNFAPSNLNRDDTGSPKDCDLGGVRRARVSSQCLKRAIRAAFGDYSLLREDERASRTKLLVEQVGGRVAARSGRDKATAERAVTRALAGAGLKTDEATGKTQYLLFVPTRTLDAIADVVAQHIDALAVEATGDEAKPKKGDKKKEKAEGKAQVSSDVRDAIVALLADGSRTPELALFGRMIADSPDWNVDAACQVAHGISTHRVSMEFDFYTAIDDLKRDDTAGSDMMGTIPFNSACFYRYLVVDTEEVARNLGAEAPEATDQARRTVEALVRAAVLAIPTGKQNSMAAHNLPSLVLATVRGRGEPRSLANAFVKPARASAQADLVDDSVTKLSRHLAALDEAYGKGDRRDFFFAVDDTDELDLSSRFANVTGAKKCSGLDPLVAAVRDAAFGAST